MTHASSLAAARQWLLQSGIQEQTGGVARYYRADTGANLPVSTEITGYAASALAFLAAVTDSPESLGAARRAANFLHSAWNTELGIFPFECEPNAEGQVLSYFFDTGIIIRGLLAVWKATGNRALLDTAARAAYAMQQDFAGEGDWHPVLELPSKKPLERQSRWSRGVGGYQLKAALAWLDVARATRNDRMAEPFHQLLRVSLETHREWLPGTDDTDAAMDRIHPYCYFLEGAAEFVSQRYCREEYRWALDHAGKVVRDLSGQFLRADVCAQLLRARLLVADTIPVDRAAAKEEFEELMRFQAGGDDPKIAGGFWFGRRGDTMVPHVSPVPAAFAVQAIAMWADFEAGRPLSRQHAVI